MASQIQRRSPFGILEQDELDYLRFAGLEPFDGWLLVILRVRFDARTKTVTDSIASLARWSGLGERNVQYGLASLQRVGLIRRAKQRVTGGARGQAWSWTTTLVPYEDWPAAPVLRPIVTMQAYLKVFYPTPVVVPDTEEEHADSARTSQKSTHRTTEEHAQNGGRARTATRDNPDSRPELLPASSAGVASKDEDATKKRVEVALAELREADYDLESRDRPFLAAYAATHPLVDLPDEIAKWAGQDGPRTFKGLAAWLGKARPTDRMLKRDPYCVEPDCLNRGRGSEQRCMTHLGLAS